MKEQCIGCGCAPCECDSLYEFDHIKGKYTWEPKIKEFMEEKEMTTTTDTLRQSLTDNPNVFIQYMRNSKGCKIGCAVVINDVINEALVIGWSKYNQDKEDRPFDKDLAVLKAFNRAVKAKSFDSYPDCMDSFIEYIKMKASYKYGKDYVVVK